MVSIFTRIINNEIPSYKIYEDDKVYSFLTIEPYKLGHTLVVPKTEIADILDLPDDLIIHMSIIAKNIIAPAIKRATDCVRVGYLVEWFGVTDHMHLHLVPLHGPSEMNTTCAHKESDDTMTAIAEKIRSEIAKSN